MRSTLSCSLPRAWLAPPKSRHRVLFGSLAKRFAHGKLPTDELETERIEQAVRKLQTDSGPTQSQLPPSLDAMRQRVQSSPWVQQVISGRRVCKFSGLKVPSDTLLRVKPKLNPTNGKPMLSVDELERFSSAVGMSRYLPPTARGLFAALSDQTNHKAISDFGWIRPDIVEHSARVLRLRAAAAMHKANIEYMSHAAQPPAPLAIPAKGTTYKVKPSRLDVIRMEVNGRILRQDAMWLGTSIFLALPPPELHSAPQADQILPQLSWRVEDVLPAAGLQFIVKLPGSVPGDSTQPLPLSSEACARTVWRELLLQHSMIDSSKDIEHMDASKAFILAQFASWKAFVMPGKPEPHSEPTLSMAALEMLYSCMPQLTPKSLAYLGGASDNSTRSKRRRAKRASALSDSKHTQSESVASSTTDQVPQLATEAVISYEYSLTRSGYPSATTDGAATKTVPVYDAQAIFGHSASATVVPWLLGLPINASSGAIDGDRIPPPSSTARYIGVVALPCTAELATQMHRLVTFASNV